MRLSNVLYILGDETRLRILNLLTRQELCVCLIEDTLNIPQYNVSKHLIRLRNSGIIRCRRIAQWCFYSIDESFKEQFQELFESFINLWKKDKQYIEDLKRLEYQLETNDCCKKLLLNLNN
ncbi:MAG: ArsR/SmtB family transcription factor [Burkholderiales bacterium]